MLLFSWRIKLSFLEQLILNARRREQVDFTTDIEQSWYIYWKTNIWKTENWFSQNLLQNIIIYLLVHNT